MAEPQRLRGLYAITPPGLGLAGDLAVVEAALRGGVVLLQYREKDADAASRLATAHALRRLCRQFGARLLINDDLVLALAVAADGVHLGVSDGDLRVARQALPAGCLLGASAYGDFERARAAVAAGADYVAFGSVHPSATKPLAPPAAWSLFARCRAELGVPSCAIGGITLDNAPPLLAAGADMLAVISDLFTAADVEARAAAYQSLFEDQPSEFAQPATV